METDLKIGIIGGGAMGKGLAEGLLKQKAVLPQNIIISNPRLEKLKDIVDKGVTITSDNKMAAKEADILVFAVKPWKLGEVVEEVYETINLSSTEIAVIVAGISGEEIIEMFGKVPLLNISIAMPNTAMSVGDSMTFVVPLSGKHKNVLEVFDKLGNVKIIEERLLPSVTALASCGIAYALRYIRAASEGGVELGINAKDAREIVCQTIKGAVSLLDTSSSHPEVEIDKVTTPGGITIKGLNTMEKYGFSTSVIEGLKASRK